MRPSLGVVGRGWARGGGAWERRVGPGLKAEGQVGGQAQPSACFFLLVGELHHTNPRYTVQRLGWRVSGRGFPGLIPSALCRSGAAAVRRPSQPHGEEACPRSLGHTQPCTGAPSPSHTVQGHTQGPHHTRDPQAQLVTWTPEMEPVGGTSEVPFPLFLRGCLASTGPSPPRLGKGPFTSCKQASASSGSGDPGPHPGVPCPAG